MYVHTYVYMYICMSFVYVCMYLSYGKCRGIRTGQAMAPLLALEIPQLKIISSYVRIRLLASTYVKHLFGKQSVVIIRSYNV